MRQKTTVRIRAVYRICCRLFLFLDKRRRRRFHLTGNRTPDFKDKSETPLESTRLKVLIG